MNYEKKPQPPDPFVKQLYYLNGNLMVNYSYNMDTYFSYYDKNFKLKASGKYALTDEKQTPFQPICQIGDKLITAAPTDDTPGAVLPDRSIQAVIILHSAK